MKKTDLKIYFKELQKQKMQKEQEIQTIEKQIEAVKVLINPNTQKRYRKGIHLDIKNIIQQNGPMTIPEIQRILVQSEKLQVNQPYTTIYNALKRRKTEFYRDNAKKWHLNKEKLSSWEEDLSTDNKEKLSSWEEDFNTDNEEEDEDFLTAFE